MQRQLPDINTVDFSDPIDIGGFVSLLCQTAAIIGITLPDFKPTRESNEIRSLANKTVKILDSRMPLMSIADAFMTVNTYDFAYRLAYSTSADRKFLNIYVLKAFDAMVHGNKEVNEYAMFREIRRAVSRRDKSYFDKPLYWSCISLERWYREAIHGYEQSGLSDYDILNRVTILLESDLYAFEGLDQIKFKKRIFEQHRHYLDDHDAASWNLLNAINQFVMASCEFFSVDEFYNYKAMLNKELTNCHSINRFISSIIEDSSIAV